MPKIKFTPEEEAEAAAWFNSPEFEATKLHEIFTHVDHEERKIRHFNATRVNDAIARGVIPYKVHRVPITEADYQQIVTANGIEEPRVARLTYDVCRRPATVAEFYTGEHVLIDGNHRIVRRYREGLDWFPACFVTENVWTKFLIKMPRLVERLKVEDTLNAQIIPHEKLYGLKDPFDAYETVTG